MALTLHTLLNRPWVTRLAPLPPEVVPLDTPRTIAVDERYASAVVAPLTMTVPRRPAFWPSVSAPALAQDPRHPFYTRTSDGSALHASEADVDDALDLIAAWQKRCAQEVDSTNGMLKQFWEGESDIANKLSVQKGRHCFSFLGRLGPDVEKPPPVLPANWRPTARALLRGTAAKADPATAAALITRGDPTDTNPGWPFLGGGLLGRLGGAALVTPPDTPVEEVNNLWVFACSLLGMPPQAAAAFTLAYRSGPSNKDTVDYRPMGPGVFTAHQIVKRGAPRARHVFMAASPANACLRRLWAETLAACKNAWPAYDQTLPFSTALAVLSGLSWADSVAKAAAASALTFENDISGYDQAVSRVIQEALRDEWADAFPHLRESINLWYELEGKPVVTPPWSHAVWSPSIAHKVPLPGYTLVGSNGGTHSGIKLTAVVGSLLCMTTTLACLAQLWRRAPEDVVRMYLQGQLTILDLGDDILVMLTKEQVSWLPADWEEQWDAYWLSCGFVAKRFNGTRYLMKHTFPGGRFSIASRIIQQSLFPEYEPVGPDGAALAAIGFLARTEDAPPSLPPEFFACLKQAKWLRDTPGAMAATTLPELRRVVRKHWEAAMIRWMQTHVGDAAQWAEEADFRPSSRALFEYVQKLGLANLMVPVETAKANFWKAYWSIARRCNDRRLSPAGRTALRRDWLLAVAGTLTDRRAKLQGRPGGAIYRSLAAHMPLRVVNAIMPEYYPELVVRLATGE